MHISWSWHVFGEWVNCLWRIGTQKMGWMTRGPIHWSHFFFDHGTYSKNPVFLGVNVGHISDISHETPMVMMVVFFTIIVGSVDHKMQQKHLTRQHAPQLQSTWLCWEQPWLKNTTISILCNMMQYVHASHMPHQFRGYTMIYLISWAWLILR